MKLIENLCKYATSSFRELCVKNYFNKKWAKDFMKMLKGIIEFLLKSSDFLIQFSSCKQLFLAIFQLFISTLNYATECVNYDSLFDFTLWMLSNLGCFQQIFQIFIRWSWHSQCCNELEIFSHRVYDCKHELLVILLVDDLFFRDNDEESQ